MKISDLIEAAKKQVGSYQEIAARLNVKPPRISEMKKGTYKASAEQICELAVMAGLPEVTTLRDVQKETDPEAAKTWERLLGKLTAAGVAATVGAMLVMAPQQADASPSQVNAGRTTLYIMSTVRRVSEWLASSLRRMLPKPIPC